MAEHAVSNDPAEAKIKAGWAAGNVFPLWENEAAHAAPRGPEKPYCWKWPLLRAFAEEALALRDTKAVERRVLQLMSPHSQLPKPFVGSTTNIAGNIQVLKPGEAARAHRHGRRPPGHNPRQPRHLLRRIPAFAPQRCVLVGAEPHTP